MFVKTNTVNMDVCNRNIRTPSDCFPNTEIKHEEKKHLVCKKTRNIKGIVS